MASVPELQTRGEGRWEARQLGGHQSLGDSGGKSRYDALINQPFAVFFVCYNISRKAHPYEVGRIVSLLQPESWESGQQEGVLCGV